MQHEMWKVQMTLENSKTSLDPEEECELKWRRWKNFLHGIIFHLKHGRHSDVLNEKEKQVVEEWSKCFKVVEHGNLRQLSGTSGTELTPVTSYLECFKRISECHVRPGLSGRVEHLDFQGTLRAALDGCIWPMAEDDVHEYLKLCFQCRLTTEKSHLLSICDTSYKADLPSCFLGPPSSSMLFCGEAQDVKQMPPSKDISSRDQSTQGTDTPVDPVPRKGRKPKSTASSQQPAKGNNATKSLQKTLAKAKKTLIKATTEQGKKQKSKKTKSEGLLKSPVDHENGFEPTSDNIPALAPSPSGVNKDDLKKDHVNKNVALQNGKSNSRKRAMPEDFETEADWPRKRLNLGEPNMDNSMNQGLTDDTIMQEPKNKGSNMEMIVEEFSKTASTACAGCGFKATSQTQLSDHWRLGSSTKKRHKCCLCSFTCKSFEKFSNHVEKIHSLPKLSAEKAPLVCSFCPYVVAVEYQEKFDEHVKKCKEAFEIESSLKAKSGDNSVSHKVKEGSQIQIDPVPECPTDQPQEVSQSDPSGIPTRATVTPDCHLPMNAFPQIYNHLCEICCTLWDSPASLEYHLSILHKIHLSQLPFKVLARSDPLCAPPKPFFPCTTCGDRFWSIKGLTLHEEFVHGTPSEKTSFAGSYHSNWRKTEFPNITMYMARHHVTIADMLMSKFCALCSEKLSCPRSFETHMLTLHKSAFPNRQALYSTLFSQISNGEGLPSDLSSSIETLKHHTPSSSFITLLLKSTPREEGQIDFPKLSHVVGINEHERKNTRPQGHQCPYCECQFTSQSIMPHINQYHQVRCTNCQECFSSRNAHGEHVRLFHCDVEGESSLLGDVKVTMSAFEDMEGGFNVLPSDWKPSSLRPQGKIPLYVENSSGIWVPQPQEDIVEAGSCGMRFPLGILGH